EAERDSLRGDGLGGGGADRTPRGHRLRSVADPAVRRRARPDGGGLAGIPREPLVREGAHPSLPLGRAEQRARGRAPVQADPGDELPGRGRGGTAPVVHVDRSDAVYRRLKPAPHRSRYARRDSLPFSVRTTSPAGRKVRWASEAFSAPSF